MAALAGVILTSRVNTGSAVFGDQTPMLVIAAAVLGGTSLFGGKGTVIGTIQGVLILGLIERAMVIFNVDTNYQLLVRGTDHHRGHRHRCAHRAAPGRDRDGRGVGGRRALVGPERRWRAGEIFQT